jgi:hypothetical protein
MGTFRWFWFGVTTIVTVVAVSLVSIETNHLKTPEARREAARPPSARMDDFLVYSLPGGIDIYVFELKGQGKWMLASSVQGVDLEPVRDHDEPR